MSLKITIMNLLIPCEYSSKYCSYKFIHRGKKFKKKNSFILDTVFMISFRCVSISCLHVVKYGWNVFPIDPICRRVQNFDKYTITYSLRKHPFLLALRRCGRPRETFPAAKSARRNWCFRRLNYIFCENTFSVVMWHIKIKLIFVRRYDFDWIKSGL